MSLEGRLPAPGANLVAPAQVVKRQEEWDFGVGAGVGLLATTYLLRQRRTISAWHLAQTLWGTMPFVLVMCVWPLLRPTSYRRARSVALAACVVNFFGLPVLTDMSVKGFSAADIPPSGVPVLGLALDAFFYAFGTSTWHLVFLGLGARLPFRAHLWAQGASTLLIGARGHSCLCEGELFTSPVSEARLYALHRWLALLASPLLPVGDVLIPDTSHKRCRAMLFLGWALAFLVTSLAALPAAAPGRRRRRRQQRTPGEEEQQHAGGGGKGRDLVTALERLLHGLSWPKGAAEGQQELRVACVVRWWVLVCVSWGVSCLAADPPPGFLW